MIDEKDDFYDEKIYTLEDIEKCLEEADKRDGITDENREEMFREAVKEFIDSQWIESNLRVKVVALMLNIPAPLKGA